MRTVLDRLYDAAAYLAAFFMVGTLAMILASVLGRQFHFYLRGSDAYAGYCMAASCFLGLAHTLRRREHIRVSLILDRLHGNGRRALEIWCHSAGLLAAASLAWFSARLVWQSYAFNDISQGNDATPLWMPQLGMALGTVVLLIAFADELIAVLRGEPIGAPEAPDGPARVE